MNSQTYYILCAVLSLGVLLGIKWMSNVKTAVLGNRLSAVCMLIAIIMTLLHAGIVSQAMVWVGLVAGSALGVWITMRSKMIAMPQLVGLLNGLGGAASAIAAWLVLNHIPAKLGAFELVTSALALAVGALTFSGSMIAAGKLHRLLPQKPLVLPQHQMLLSIMLLLMILSLLLMPFLPQAIFSLSLVCLVSGLLFGILFALRVGGADMPITISLLNSTSGVAAAIAGMAINDLLLVAIGGIVGASGLLLTQIMCRAMNRSLVSILLGISAAPAAPAQTPPQQDTPADAPPQQSPDPQDAAQWLGDAQNIIIIPGYGMALSQAQQEVKQLLDRLEAQGKTVRFGIHPVAGRMPGHMNVLLAEVDIPYDKLYEMDAINADFAQADLAIVIGANDVVNPAANTAKDTPIYGMPVLDAAHAKRLMIFNFDLKPGYAGVPNPLYEPQPTIMLLLGDAKQNLSRLLEQL